MKISLAQYAIVWEDPDENLLIIKRFFEMAKKAGSDMILFPETCATGFSMNTSHTLDPDVMTRILIAFEKMAKEYHIACGFGQYLIRGKGPVNAYFILDKEAKVEAVYEKIHLFAPGGETEHYYAGRQIATGKVEDITLAPFICYDLRFPEIFQLASKEADLLIVAANWPASRKEHWLSLLKARAIENQCYIAGINRTGEGDGIVYTGDSILYGPDGECLAAAQEEEELLTCEISYETVKKLRSDFPVKEDRREGLYRFL